MLHLSLDKKDKDLLFELSLDGRISITKLAQRLKVSKQVVSYRLQQLEKNGAILGYYAITNSYQLGMTHYRLYIKYQNMSQEKEKEFMTFLKNHKKVIWLVYLDGDMDAAIAVWAKNIHEFEDVQDEIKEKYGIYFQDCFFSISTRIEYLKYKFLNGARDTSSRVFGGGYDNIELDELDANLLQDLNTNGRATLVELANKYNSSAKVIRSRIERLVKRGVIIGFNVKIDHNLVGYTHHKIFLKLNDVRKEKVLEWSKYLKHLKCTIYLVKPIGNFDFEVELMTESDQEFHDFMKNLRSRFASEIKSYNSVIHYEEPKSGQL